ncbi:hypothetical protein BDQ17DRAFT_1344799 [Cyathus striatus]|nr:hypothetical protein BDQ17DRAFT_1344799 [Cyathus striatus]
MTGRKKKRAKHRHKRSAASRFLDIEAEVSDEDEDEEEAEEDLADGFIEAGDDMDEDISRRRHAILDSKRQFDEEDKSPEQIARELSKRWGGRSAVRYTGDMNEIPQRLLMPSVHDASLWQVRVKPGRERDIIFSLMRKSIDMEYTANPLSILSAFQRDSLPGMIYVEAKSSKQVQQACNGLVGVYPSRGIHLVPIEEMASLLQIKKQDQTVNPGMWVRIKRGKYAGDLAQVIDVTENGEDVGLKFIPRIDLTPRDDASLDSTKKRKKTAVNNTTMRPPQRLFNYEEVVKVYGRKHVSKRGHTYTFQGDSFKDGFIEKDFKISALTLEDVNPTLDEITQFSRRQDGEGDNLVDLSVIAEASRKAAIAVLQPGDHIEVFEGEQAGVHGVVDEVNGDVVTITAIGVDIDGQKIELPARSVRKRFKPGDHVKVMSGQNADETGLVVSVTDNVVTFLSDMSMQEVSVFSKDLREAAEVGSGTNIVGNYELHDLVQLDAQTVGVIYKTERDSFRVLDQNGQTRLVQPHQISMRRDSNRSIAVDSEHHELRINDNVKEMEGEKRKGRVLHIYQSFYAFLHNRDIAENGGVFVTRTQSLASLAPKGNMIKPAGMDLSKMNPAMAVPIGGMVGSGAMGRGPRDRHIGVTVVVVKGAHKGYAGTIKDTNGQIARVELRTGNKIISIEKDKLYRRLPDGKLEPLDKPMGFGGGRGGHNGGGRRGGAPFSGGYGGGANSQQLPSGGRTPWGGAGRTPNPYAAESGKTPAWGATGRTPNPYADGGKTPAWSAGSKTPNPYADSGKTPAWSAGSKTPNPYAAAAAAGGEGGWGGATPGRGTGGWGGATPGRPASSSSAPTGGWGGATPGRTTSSATSGGWGAGGDSSWGGASPGRGEWGGNTWSAPTPAAAAWSAPTPAAAATPGMHLGQTPAAYAAVFSGADGSSAMTPGVWGNSTFADIASTKEELPQDWIFDIHAVNYQNRIKVRVHGTVHDEYLHGEFEGRLGRVVAANKYTSREFEQTTVVRFESGEERTILAKYLIPIHPNAMDDEVLVLGGSPEHRGEVAIVRGVDADDDESMVTVSPKETKMPLYDAPKKMCVCLWPEA